MAPRLFSLASLVVFLFIFPWWLFFLLAFILVFLLEDFYEVILPFLIFDLIYGSPSFWFKPAFLGTIFALFLLLLSDFLKERVALFRDSSII